RFLAVGRAYVTFALEEPHLYRHMFGPAGAAVAEGAAEGDDGAATEREVPEPDEPYGILLAVLAELADDGLLRPGVADDPALDVFAWSLVHGFSSLMIEGHLPLEAGEGVLVLFGRLVLTDEGYATFCALDAQQAALDALPLVEPVGR
ncbi:MAG: TetR-like C-terminal domain-containing protein, partial [Kineosporiaceae bacterium]